MRPEDVTIDTPLGEVDAAIDRGDFTLEDFGALLRGRLRRESAERSTGGVFAIEKVKESENRKRARRAKFRSKFIVGGDGWRGYLVTCGRACWHVDEKVSTVKRIR